MALGEYVSVSSQRDTEQALLDKERRELAEDPHSELLELAAIYRAKGLSEQTARQVAEELSAGDVFRAATGMVLLSPVFIAVAVMIKLDSRGPVFFRQVRMGAGGRTFRVFKFRTMVADAESMKLDVAHLNMHNGGDARMFKVPDDPRVTRLGRLLRRWRIDELPQLLNVLAGTMSIVGPRPLILDEDQHVSSWARRRLDLKPGITGLWQVLGASDIPFEEMTKLDYLYVTNWSLREDLRLILLTLPALTRARSAY